MFLLEKVLPPNFCVKTFCTIFVKSLFIYFKFSKFSKLSFLCRKFSLNLLFIMFLLQKVLRPNFSVKSFCQIFSPETFAKSFC
jgi:hypothetical protein